MAVILYAGGFASFFLGEWRQSLVVPTEGHEAAVTSDFDDEADDEDGSEGYEDKDDEEPTPANVRAYFEQVRSILTSSLQPLSTDKWTWSEDPARGFDAAFTSVTDIGALMLIVARAQANNKRLAPIAKGRPWYEDCAVEELQDAESDFQAVHHLVKADTWLPGDFNVVAATEVPERTLMIGSLPRLAQALTDAAALLQPGSEAIRKLSPEFVTGARQAHAAFTKVAAFAAANGTPMLVDTVNP